MKQFLLSLQFLTILPVKIKGQVLEEDYKGIFSYFPLVGACIGLLLALVSLILGCIPYVAMVACILCLSIVVTGALHIDGFADTCDGFFSGKPKDKILEIMQDSRIGTMGCVGICTILILKLTFLISLPHAYFCKVLILSLTYSRWAQGLACCLCKYARTSGKSNYFFKYVNTKDIVIGAIAALIIFLILAGLKGFCIFSLGLIPVLIFIKFSQSKIGGMTGDTLGATNEIAELSILFLGLIFLK